ncbi:MAG TPA: hypothetical protein VNV85_18000 [Puia sp.]|nr:hypothetical protein [Puia sp.]
MARKQWVQKTEITPSLERFREKRKWQIALRRYVIEKKPCLYYAPYFGLDIKTIRQWFECQFQGDVGWTGFGKQWQFDHVIPVTFFDFSVEQELKMCWNFTNLRVDHFERTLERQPRVDILAAKSYFTDLYQKTHYTAFLKLLKKIEKIERSDKVDPARQLTFVLNNKAYLDTLENYSAFEFELLNSGRSPVEVAREMAFLKTLPLTVS